MSSKGSIDQERAPLRNNVAPGYWWNDAGLRRLAWHLFVLQMGSIVVGFDGSLLNGWWAIERFMTDMGNPDANMQGLISCAVPIGFVLSFFPFAYWSDRRGRREPQIGACVLIVVGTFVQTFSITPWSLFASRIIIGIGGGCMVTLGCTHIIELSHPRNSIQNTCMFGANYGTGAIIASWLCFGTTYMSSSWSWRLPAIMQGVPSLFQGIALFWTPESPRWLASVGRDEEAHAILAKYHANGKMDDPLVLDEMTQIRAELDIAQQSSHVRYRDFFKTSANRKRLFIVCYVGALVQLAGNGIISFYLTPILEQAGIGNVTHQQGINGGLSIWSFLWAVFAAVFSQRMGRRVMWLSSIGGMLISYVIFTVLSAVYARTGNAAAGQASVAFIFTFNAAYALAGTALAYTYALELLPQRLRTKGIAISNFVDQLAAVFNQYVNPVAFTSISYRYFIVYICVLTVSLVVAYLNFPETMNLTLEQSAILLDDGEVSNRFEKAADSERVVADHQSALADKTEATATVVPAL